ncbi:hypothetical protein F5X68DRAFT_262639 [Plectosphaerella plurivora]|uniref:Sec20 C-terminal domain-containing protein n=1 Tax=Plectosphaerella plurivora TaxID=936078 RepID=A0A9P9AAL1_9PEZI|nr:hypothetical protein F5X68DRAFT_262639 [Plectosphaerella plurivora]
MSFEGLQERLTALQETTTQLKELIARLQNLHFEPGSVPLGADEDNVASELSTEIGQILREEEEELELLQEEVEDVRGGRPGSEAEHTKVRLKDGVQRLKEELKSSRVTFRKAQLAAKRSLAESQRLERKLLLQSFSQPISQTSSPPPGAASDDGNRPASVRPEVVRHRHAHHQQQQTSSLTEEDQQTVGAAGNVTAALRRTHDIIAAELARSEFAHQTLTESSAALSRLDDSYGSLEGMLASSKDLLGTLVRSQKSDTWYLQTAMYMLMVTGAWLVFRRILYGPMWWLVWLPLRLMYNLVAGGGSALVRSGGEVSSPGVVFGDNKVEVDGIPGEELPTIEVGSPEPSEGAEAESLEEKIGKILDEVAEVAEADGEVDDGSVPVEETVDQRQRDEL